MTDPIKAKIHKTKGWVVIKMGSKKRPYFRSPERVILNQRLMEIEAARGVSLIPCTITYETR